MKQEEFIIPGPSPETAGRSAVSLIPDFEAGIEQEAVLELAKERGDFEAGGVRLIAHEKESFEELKQLVSSRMQAIRDAGKHMISFRAEFKRNIEIHDLTGSVHGYQELPQEAKKVLKYLLEQAQIESQRQKEKEEEQ